MEITVNGQVEQTDSETVDSYIRGRGLKPDALVVELNGVVLPADQWAATRLGAGDRLELLSFVGGG